MRGDAPLCGWEGNRRSGIALAVSYRLQWFTYGLKAYERTMSTPPTRQWSMARFTFTFTRLFSKHRLGPPLHADTQRLCARSETMKSPNRLQFGSTGLPKITRRRFTGTRRKKTRDQTCGPLRANVYKRQSVTCTAAFRVVVVSTAAVTWLSERGRTPHTANS